MAHRLADMHDVAPELTQAVAARVSTSELHDQALRDLGGFVHRTVVEDERVYAVRIDDGVLLDAAEQVEHARRHLSAERHAEAAAALGCEPDKLDSELDALAARARSGALKLRVDATLRDRAANGRYGWVFERGQDFAAGIWVIDPVFMIDAVRQQLADARRRDRPRGDLLRRRAPRRRRAARRRRRGPPSGAPPSAPATPRRPPATSRSATTSAPRSPTRPTTSSARCARSSAGCCASTIPS